MSVPFRHGTPAARTAPTPLPPEGGQVDTELGAALAALLDELPYLPVRMWPAVLPEPDLAASSPHLRFAPETYTRTPLAATPNAEMLLMGWLPGQASRIHDHGASQGFMRVLAGSGVEDTFTLQQGLPRPASTRTFRRGDLLFELPGVVHRLGNPGPDLLVTIHVYAPRLQEYRTYDEP